MIKAIEIEYDAKTKRLTVIFDPNIPASDRSRKTYMNVDLPAVDAFRASESPEFHHLRYIAPVYKEVGL